MIALQVKLQFEPLECCSDNMDNNDTIYAGREPMNPESLNPAIKVQGYDKSAVRIRMSKTSH